MNSFVVGLRSILIEFSLELLGFDELHSAGRDLKSGRENFMVLRELCSVERENYEENLRVLK